MGDELFVGADGSPRRLRGAAVLSGSLQIAELAGLVGFDTVWLDVEHGGASYADVERACAAIEAGGAVPTVRIANGEREHVLKALEVGARIVVVPMVNTPEMARQVVRWGKFPPLGERGFNARSRAMRYSLDPPPGAFERANRETYLFVQIETVEATRNVRQICEVEGLSGILIGPGDLSASMGKPAQFTDPELIALASGCIREARGADRHAAILAGPGPLLSAALEAGADLVYCAGDVNDLARAWREILAAVP